MMVNIKLKMDTPNWVLNSRLEQIISLLDCFENIKIEHIFREGNIEADSLANMGADGNNFVVYNHN